MVRLEAWFVTFAPKQRIDQVNEDIHQHLEDAMMSRVWNGSGVLKQLKSKIFSGRVEGVVNWWGVRWSTLLYNSRSRNRSQTIYNGSKWCPALGPHIESIDREILYPVRGIQSSISNSVNESIRVWEIRKEEARDPIKIRKMSPSFGLHGIFI